MKITKAKAKLLEDVAIALKPIINQPLKDSREANIVIAPYSTDFYSFGYLSSWYLASCIRCKDHLKDFVGDELNETKNSLLYKEAFEKYMASMEFTIKQSLELSTTLRKNSHNNLTDVLNEEGKKFLKNHARMVAYLIQEHYVKLFAKYDEFDARGIPLAVKVLHTESEAMNGFILKERHISF
jgi:hypothetical protein